MHNMPSNLALWGVVLLAYGLFLPALLLLTLGVRHLLLWWVPRLPRTWAVTRRRAWAYLHSVEARLQVGYAGFALVNVAWMTAFVLQLPFGATAAWHRVDPCVGWLAACGVWLLLLVVEAWPAVGLLLLALVSSTAPSAHTH